MITALLLLLVATGGAATQQAQTQSAANGFAMKSAYTSGNIINFRLPQYELNQVEEFGNQFVKLEISDAGTVVQPGEPYLPSLSTLYVVDPGKSYDVTIRVIETELVRDVNLLPHQTWDQVDGGIQALNRDQSVYLSEQFPATNIMVSEPLVMRDLNLVQVTVTPFNYSPLSRNLEIITRAEIELHESEASLERFVPAKRSAAFETLYRSLAVNYDQFMANIPYQKPSILYVLPANSSSIQATVNLLLDWRKKCGYEVHQVDLSTTGSTAQNVKDFIQNAYTTWSNPPEHVTFVGDAEGSYNIPTWPDVWSYYNGDGDHPYACLVGGDNLPEIFLGRISFSSTSELSTIIAKTVNYESNPYLGENWFKRAILVSDASSSGISTVITNEFVQMLMENDGYFDVRTLYSVGSSHPNASQMVTQLNDGGTFFNYRGYLGVSGFGSDDVNLLNNGYRLPVATILTCGSGSFGSGTSLSETIVRAGTLSVPKGAVACIGTATLGTHTMFNNCVAMGFYSGIFLDGIETAGAALMRGKLQLYLTYPTNPNNYVYIFSHWNSLIGDSALRMWTAMPVRVTVTTPPSVPIGTNTLEVNVTHLVGGLPVENALVTLLKGNDEINESILTDADGIASLPINSYLTGAMDLTVTRKNYKPETMTVVLTSPGENINISQLPTIISDDNTGQSAGNSNGDINPGETIEYTTLLKNFGNQDINDVSAKLVSRTNGVNMLVDSLYFGTITAGTSDAGAGDFVFSVSEGLSDEVQLEFDLVITSGSGGIWTSALDLELAGSQLAVDGVVVSAVGGILDPGETSDMMFAVENLGQINATGITGIISTPASGIEILDDEGSWDLIPVGTTITNTTDVFSLSAAESIIPGTAVDIYLNIATAEGYSANIPVSIRIGTADVTDPTGPDEHGYYIYDSGDIFYSNAPFFNWIEISADQGGPGSNTYLSDDGNNDDDVTTLTLPFNFRMYGINYRDISICSNGWIGMGDTPMRSFRNYHLPGAAGPSPMIAAFWDDLKTTYGGDVWHWYDTDHHQYIIQWSELRTYYNDDVETFQVILRDPQYYFTPTGDGEILIQYLEFNNTSQTTSSATNHGNYSTIGIEDHTAQVGIEYTFGNVYAPTAMALQDCTAILITTKGSTIRLRGDLNDDNILDIFDVLGMIDYILAGNPGSLNPYLADVNDDGVVNILDMIRIVQTIMEY